MGDARGEIQGRLIEQAQIRPGYRVLDLGCGTGTLTLMIKQAHPQAGVTGLDVDREVLALARQKTTRSGVQIAFDEGLAWDMPYPEKFCLSGICRGRGHMWGLFAGEARKQPPHIPFSTAIPKDPKIFDRVFSSLMVHHMTSENKRRTFLEIFRVLKPAGEFHLLDFGKPHSIWMCRVAAVMRNLEEAAENFAGRIPSFLEETGFIQVEETGYEASVFGPLSRYQAVRPGQS